MALVEAPESSPRTLDRAWIARMRRGEVVAYRSVGSGARVKVVRRIATGVYDWLVTIEPDPLWTAPDPVWTEPLNRWWVRDGQEKFDARMRTYVGPQPGSVTTAEGVVSLVRAVMHHLYPGAEVYVAYTHWWREE